jgi:PAS domain S-box-containing protein
MLDLIKNILRRFLAPSQDGVRLLFEQAPFGVAMVDTATGAVVSVNDNFASLVGRTASSLHQAPWSTLVRSVWQAGQTQAPDLFDQPPAAEGQVHQLLRTDDARIFAEISVFARLTDRRGQSVCVVMVKDVSKQVAAQAQLRVSEERLRVLTDSALDVVWTMSPLGELTYVSPAIEQLRGYTPEEAMKHTIDQTLTPDSQVVSLQYFVDVATAMQQGLPPPEFRSELEYWRKDGTRFWTEVLAFPLLGTDGSLVEILGVSRDISQRRLYEDSLRQARQRAEQANAAKTEFLAHVSHEIRTPMGAILALTDLALNTPLDDHQRDLLSKSKTAGRLLLGIINDILDLSKLEHGQLVLAQLPFDLRDVLQQVSDLVCDACVSKGLLYEVEIAPEVITHRLGDAQRLAQVLLNLVGNAIKFTAQGHVRVRVRCVPGDDDALRLEVQDTGIGLAPELQDKVFEGFVQGDNEATRAQGGTGLGLSICQRLARQMGGDVGVQSQVGVGSTFWTMVRLPVSSEDKVQSSQSQDAVASDAVAGLHVLLAEDNLSMRGILKQLLELAGAQVSVAENGQAAVQMVMDRHCDLVLMDIQMPVMGGLEAARHIRKNPEHQALPIVALTAGGFTEDRERCLEAGMNDYLMKPFEYKDLIEVLQRNVPGWRVKA